MDLVGAGGDRGQRVGDGQAAIVVAVPIDADVFAAGFDDFVDGKFYEVVGALRVGVADGVAEARSRGRRCGSRWSRGA